MLFVKYGYLKLYLQYGVFSLAVGYAQQILLGIMLSNNKKTSLNSADMAAAITTINASHTLNDLINNWQDIMGFTATSYHHFPSVGSFDFKNMSRYYSHNIPDYITDYFNDNKRARADPSVLKE